MKKKLFLLSLVLFLAGCAQQLKPGMMLVYSQPIVQVEKDPDIDFGEYRFFAVHPTAELDSSSKMNAIIEKQLLFALRNRLELLGYRYVDDIDEADFYLGIYYSNEYKSTYIPPTVTTIPWYVPGQTQTTYMNLYGSTGSHWGTATTTTPGYYIPMTYTTPGRYTGAYYPSISATVFDKGTNKVVWSSRATVSTPENDIRLSGQWLLDTLWVNKEGNHNFPLRGDPRKRDDSKNGSFGILPRIITLDGNNFYPDIIGLFCGSPAHNQGLRIYDTITHIDGKNTENWAWSDVISAFDRNTGEELILTVKRGEKKFDVSLIAENEAVAKITWKKIKCPDQKGNVITKKITTAP